MPASALTDLIALIEANETAVDEACAAEDYPRALALMDERLPLLRRLERLPVTPEQEPARRDFFRSCRDRTATFLSGLTGRSHAVRAEILRLRKGVGGRQTYADMRRGN